MGAAGDMLMSALYEICESKDIFLDTMNEVFAPYHVTFTPEAAVKCGINGTHIRVAVDGEEEIAHEAVHAHPHDDNAAETAHDDEPFHKDTAAHETAPSEEVYTKKHSHHHTSYAAICEEIGGLALPEQVRKDALAIYHLIGEAEAKVHGTSLEQIHFHEVGTLDALADVTGCALLFYLISPKRIVTSPIHVGNGFVHCAHGVLPVPAPATAEILKGVPYYTGVLASELCTPTGAAILKYYTSEFSTMPTMTTEAIGYGMGHKDFPIANCVRIFAGSEPDDSLPKIDTSTDAEIPPENNDSFPDDDSVLTISCNIDDMTGEAMGLATEIFMAAGALDVFTIPIQMKKNRPGILLTCICRPEDKDKFTGLFFLHTSTRGVRYQTYSRAKLESSFETRPTAYGDIRIKKSSGYGIEKEKPEFEDLKSVVLKNKCSFSLDEVAKAIPR
jgi:hypothetical protein